jgi:hypothetical protein
LSSQKKVEDRGNMRVFEDRRTEITQSKTTERMLKKKKLRL